MNENKQKEKHTLRNVLITLLVLCVLGGGGYFGYVKYLEYQEEQTAATEYQEKVDEALKGVSEEDAAKLTDKQLKILAEATNMKGQEKALNNYGIMADMNERYNTVDNWCDLYKQELIEEDTQINANEEKPVSEDGLNRPLFIEIGNYETGIVIYDRLYGGDSLSLDGFYPYGEENPDYYTYMSLNESEVEKIRELVNNYKINPDTTVFKSYDLYWSGSENMVQEVMVNDKVPDGEPRFVVYMYGGTGEDERLVLY